MLKHTFRLVATALAFALLTTACGGGDDDEATTSSTEAEASAGEGFTVQVASYDLAADSPQRVIVGLLAEEGGLVVGGEVELAFTYQGDGTQPESSSTAEPDIERVPARFITVADGTDPGDGPKLLEGSDGVGVYEAQGVEFGKAGFWQVEVTADFNGKRRTVPAAFPVADTAAIPSAGDPAPRTENLLPGAPDAPPKAVDSRAEDDGTVPDPNLHRLTVAQAVATGKPTVVVVSTPVFCVSRFCGPITDAVDAMSTEFGDRANFVHIEVWRDFEGRALNRGAAEWIYPTPASDASEPWVFLVDGAGAIVQRWDNVTNGAALRAELSKLA